MSDREILDRLRAGEQDAFESLFRRHYAELVGLAESLLGERAAAEDVAQDVMLELWRRREHLVFETSLRAYLFTATRNRSLNRIRHERIARRTAPELARDRSAPPADRNVVELEMRAALARATEELPERCREVFLLSRVRGLSYAEIAAVLGISVKTVEAQMSKALREIRERLRPWLPPGDDL